MRVNVTGQMFYAGDRAGPMFTINSHNIDGPYLARVVSHLTGEKLAESYEFDTLGEAMEWCYGHSEW